MGREADSPTCAALAVPRMIDETSRQLCSGDNSGDSLRQGLTISSHPQIVPMRQHSHCAVTISHIGLHSLPRRAPRNLQLSRLGLIPTAL
jgi:hypothetical protein